MQSAWECLTCARVVDAAVDDYCPVCGAVMPEPDTTTCPRCEGRGVYYRLPGDPGKPCAVCDGTGKIGPTGEPTCTCGAETDPAACGHSPTCPMATGERG